MGGVDTDIIATVCIQVVIPYCPFNEFYDIYTHKTVSHDACIVSHDARKIYHMIHVRTQDVGGSVREQIAIGSVFSGAMAQGGVYSILHSNPLFMHGVSYMQCVLYTTIDIIPT